MDQAQGGTEVQAMTMEVLDTREDMATIALVMVAQVTGITLIPTVVLILMITTMAQEDITTEALCMEVADTTKVVAMVAIAMSLM